MAEFPSWQQGLRPSYPRLRGSLRTDVCIIGGGLAGLLTALMLQQSGVQVVLLERDILGHGATFGCSGVLSCQAPHVYRRVNEKLGLSAAKTLAAMMRESVRSAALLARHMPLCRCEERSVYLYAETEADLPALESILALEEKLGLKLALAEDAGGCPFPVELSAVMQHQYILSPLPLLLAAAELAVKAGCRIFEHTPLIEANHLNLRTPDGAVHADAVIYCTGVPAGCLHAAPLSLLEPRLLETRVLRSTAPLHAVQYPVHADEMTLRPLPDGLLMTFDRGRYGTRQAEISRIIRDRTLRALLPEANTTDVILRREIFTRDGMPLIGPLSPRDSRILMAGGFNAHGLTGAILAAKTLCGLILSQPCAESSLFLPFRAEHTASFLLHSLQAASVRKLRRWRHVTTPRCPHMGCPLRYNPGSRQWECPCHGSGFDEFGQVLSAPALKDAQLSPKDRPV